MPHSTAPVLKYKARGMKRTLPLKYSTNLTTEAKGQRVGLLPSEGESGRRAHTVSGCGTLPTGVWMQPQHQEWGGGEGVTVLHCRHLPGPPAPQQRRSSLSLARVRGIRKKSGMESKETYFFFRSWEQRGQNLKSDKEEQGKQKVSEACALFCSALGQSVQLLPQLCHLPFPSRLGRQPHTGEVEPLDGTLEKADGTQRSRA